MLDLKYSTLLKVSVPLMFSSFVQSIVLLTDAAFLSHYSTLAFDANGNAGLLYVTFFASMFGMSDGSHILSARRIGENKLEDIKNIFQANIYILAFLALLFFTTIHLWIPDFLYSINNSRELVDAQIRFLDIRSYALFFGIITLSIESYFFAVGKTLTVLIGATLIAVSNIFMDWAFIFGFGNVAPMGLEGAALGSTLAEGLGMIYYIIVLNFHQKGISYRIIGKLKFDLKHVLNGLKVGTPLFFQSFLSIGVWTLFFTWIENMGSDELTISQNVRSVYFFAFIPIYGFAYTTKTYVSQYLGNRDLKSLKKVRVRIIILSVLFMIVFFHGAILYPETLIRLINPVEKYVVPSAEILSFVAGSFLVFSVSNVMLHTISGSGNTHVTFLIEFITNVIYAVYGYLSIKVFHFELAEVWTIEYVYFISVLVLSVLYLKFFNWKNKAI